MLNFSVLVIFFSFLTFAEGKSSMDDVKAVSYKGHQVYDVIPQTDDHLEYLMTLENDTRHIKFWSGAHQISKSMMLQVSPDALVTFQRALKEKKIPFAVKVNDLQKKIDIERHDNYPQMLFRVMGADAFDLGQYHTLEEINAYLELLNKQFSSITHLSSIGQSHEGRDIKLFHIGSHNSAGEDKPAVVIDAGIHAREWVSPATALYIIKQLLTGNDSSTVLLRDSFDWYFIPVLNPDGYVYTWTNDRLWRKNRRGDGFPHCVGVDLNRNFDIGFATRKRSHQCSDTYTGSTPFSEPETRALQTFVNSVSHRLKMAFSLHSYSQVWVTSYIYKLGYPTYYTELALMLSRALEKARLVHQTQYSFGSGAIDMYAASGTSVDWYTDVVGVKYAFIIELRDKGDHGFILPKSQILPTGEETWVAMKDIAEHVANLNQ